MTQTTALDALDALLRRNGALLDDPEALLADFDADAFLAELDARLAISPSPVVQKPVEETPPSKSLGRRVVSNILFYLALVAIVLGAFVYSNDGGNPKNPKSILGYSYFTVLSGSMQKEIPIGSLVITKQVDPTTLNVGDTITFFRDGTIVTHKIVDVSDDAGGRAFTTQGVNNLNPDTEPVPAGNVIGKVVFHVANVGNYMTILRNNLLYIFLIFALAVVLSISLRVFLRIRREEKSQQLVYTERATALL